ncbi:MAG TPA: sigma 54-interacting transcriptional regulator, partial [Thermoanaerobaculia bacterium]
PETLVESELFGHVRGAFTGATGSRPGRFELAQGGTLFLDEITEMGSELQVKLLRVLEDRTLRRVGGSQELKVDVRLISATNRDPHDAIKEKKLREDLYYRLNVFPLALPTLIERREDISLLAEHFRKSIEDQERAGVSSWDPRALELLQAYEWPGNVRELRNIVHRAYVMTEGKTIRPEVVASLLPRSARPAAVVAKKKTALKQRPAAAAGRKK